MNTRTATKRRARLGLSAIAALSLVAASCGDDSNDADETPATTEAMDEDMDLASEPFGPACSTIPMDGEGSFAGMADDPAATAASNNPALSTLVEAVSAAGLVDTLNGDGPFTIFAPVNDAFAALPPETLEAALADPEGLLTDVLTYHVVAGESLLAADLDGTSQTTVNGGDITVDGTTVNDANIVCADVPVANGTVHIIDAVLLPSMDDMEEEEMSDETPATTEAMDEESMDEDMALASEPFGPVCSTIPMDGEGSFAGMADDPAATAASNNPALSTLVEAVSAAGLVDTLNGDGPFTIFAPVNDAFAALPPETLEAALADPEGLLTDVLTYHVVAGESLLAADLDGTMVETVNGGMLSIDGTTVNGTNIVCADVPVANGTVHIIDAVLIPDSGTQEAAAGPTGAACAAVPTDGEGSFDGMADDPAATAASNNPVLSTLVTAVDAAGLVDTLNGEGPFTIFAPVNDAFAALPPETLEAALADPEGLLTDVLTYHVIAGESLGVDALVEAGTATTVNGGELTFETDADGVLMVNGVAAGCQNVTVANGTVHIIGEVLLPS